MPTLDNLKTQALMACADTDAFETEADRLTSVKAYIAASVDIEVRDLRDNDMMLVNASWRGYLAIAQYLVEHGADVHADDDLALRWSAQHGHLEVVKCLIEHGANVHVGNDLALRLSASNGRLEVVKYLVEHGADLNARDSDGNGLFDHYTKDQLAVRSYLETVEPIFDRLHVVGITAETESAAYERLMKMALSIRGLVDALSKDDLLKLATDAVCEKAHGRSLL